MRERDGKILRQAWYAERLIRELVLGMLYILACKLVKLIFPWEKGTTNNYAGTTVINMNCQRKTKIYATPSECNQQKEMDEGPEIVQPWWAGSMQGKRQEVLSLGFE